MASSSAEWKPFSAFVSIFWLSATVGTASTHIELKISPSGTAQCGENMTLSCDVSSSNKLSIKKFVWVKNKTICEYAHNETGLKGPCERKNETSLILNIINITQDDEGEYICKLSSNEGVKEPDYTVTVQACPITPPPDIDVEKVIFPTPTDSSGSFGPSTCIMVGIAMVNLMMYC